jgi:hypothetical protein
MGYLKSVVVAAAALMVFSASAKAENIFCAKQVVEDQPNNEWRVQYIGNLTGVVLTKFYSATGPRSVITCYRENGVVARNTTKTCHLVQGDAQTTLIAETETMETFRCVYKPNSYMDNNDTSCKVICD